MTLLATVAQLKILLRQPNLPGNDPYSIMMLSQASTAVRDAAGKPEWTAETAPQAAKDITLWVAHRAYTNPRNLSRRGVGPISEAFADVGVYGVELTAGERQRLVDAAGGGKRGGFWIQPLATGAAEGLLTVPSDMPGGDLLYIADAGQFPYGYDSEGRAPIPYDGPVGGV